MRHCYLKLREDFNSFSEREKKVAEYILDNPEKIIGMPIGDLAEKCGTSKATVVRLCKRIGCAGYKELCITLNAELSSENFVNYFYKDVHPGEDLLNIASSVAENSIKTIRNTVGVLDTVELDRAVTAIANADRVDFYGAGSSSLAALDAQNKLLRIGKKSFSSSDTHMQTLAAMGLNRGDVAVLISASGETNDIIEIASCVKERGATAVSLTGLCKNSIAEMADIRLYSVSDEGPVRSGAMVSRIGILTVIDILYSALTSRLYDSVKESLDRSTDAMKKKKRV